MSRRPVKFTAIKVTAGQSGMALVITLAIIAVMMTSALYLARMTTRSLTASDSVLKRFGREEAVMSAIHLSMALLATDAEKNDTDSVQDDWADPAVLAGLLRENGLGTLSLTISDELGKLQVNALLSRFPGHEMNPDQYRIWKNFLTLRTSADGAEGASDPETFINALKDWLDTGDDDAVSGLSGAESEYYLRLPFPYACANGPVRHLSELSMVKAWADFFPAVDSGKNSEVEGDTPLLPRDLLTVYGMDASAAKEAEVSFPGQVNINTAPVEIIAALLPEGMEDVAAEFIRFREEKADDGKTFVNALDKGWYHGVIDLSETENKAFERVVRYDSDLFRITARAETYETVAVVQRQKDDKTGKWRCNIIQLIRE